MSEERTAVSKIILAYRMKLGNGKGPLTYRDFAAKLSDGFNSPIPHQSVESWEKAKYLPTTALLINLSNMISDWREDFANDILAAMYPTRFEPTGNIGKEILGWQDPASAMPPAPLNRKATK